MIFKQKILIFMVSLFFLSCAMKSENKKAENPLPNKAISDIIFSTRSGQSRGGDFSASGEKIAYISWDRTESQADQLYEYDLLLEKENRITYQTGSLGSFSYFDEDYFLYSSNTDEIKENQFRHDGERGRTQGDIYWRDLTGEQIDRLTQKPGVDDWPMRHPWKKDSFYFISDYPSDGLYEFDMKTKTRNLILGGRFSQYLILKKSKSLVIFENKDRNPSAFVFDIKMKTKTNWPLPSENTLALSPTVWDDIFLIAESIRNSSGQVNSRLYYWSPTTFCLNFWREVPGIIQQIKASPKAQSLFLISSVVEKKSQVYLLKASSIAPSCARP